MRILILTALLLITLGSNSWAVIVLTYDGSGNVTGQIDVGATHLAPANSIVLDAPNNSHTPVEQAVYQANLDTYSDLNTRKMPHKYWKIVNGLLAEKTSAEKTSVDLANIQAEKDAEIVEINKLNVSTNDVIVALIKRINVRLNQNQAITKEEIIQQIKTDKGL